MGFFNKKKEMKPTNEKKGLNLNELKEDDLLNIAGGQTFHNSEDIELNRIRVANIVKSKFN